jgi:hypothetical protein
MHYRDQERLASLFQAGVNSHVMYSRAGWPETKEVDLSVVVLEAAKEIGGRKAGGGIVGHRAVVLLKGQ